MTEEYERKLKKIKKVYGERFSRMCRTHFQTILNEDEKLYEILQANFSDTSETLYEDIQKNGLEKEFVDYIFDKYEAEKKERVITDKTPYELLDEKGYTLIECHTEEEIQSFKKYYAKGEELCTFNGERLDTHIVFWAVKKNVDEIKRKDFDNPEREDDYSKSVMSIQFNREGTTRVSIKSRYNHKVDYPDAMFNNDLDKIAPGLTYSFERLLEERGLKLVGSESTFNIPGYVQANDGKYYKFNSCIDNVFYCPDNIIIKDGEVQKIPNPEKKILIDCFLIDMENKTISMYDEKHSDAFLDGLTDIQKISIVRDKESGDSRKHITIYREGQEEPIVITVDRDDRIIGYKNHELREVGDNFLKYSTGLENLDTPNLETTGNYFCYKMRCEELSLPRLKKIGNSCFVSIGKLKTCDFPQLEEVGDLCFSHADTLEKCNFPKLRKAGNHFFEFAQKIKTVDFPALTELGDRCLRVMHDLEAISAPNVKKVGKRFLGNVKKLKSLKMQSLENADEDFLFNGAEEIVEFETPKISRLKWFFSKNTHVVSIINKAKKAQRLSRKDIAHLDKQSVLLPEETEKAGEAIEPSKPKQIEDNVI